MKRIALALIAALHPNLVLAQQQEGVIIRCGASTGHSFFFHEPSFNPSGPNWDADGMANGQILLVRLGDEWDIQFDDTIGSSGYRQDGAQVIPLMESETLLTVGAFASNYVDIYTFDLKNRIVGWTSNKHGPIAPKAAAYTATCN